MKTKILLFTISLNLMTFGLSSCNNIENQKGKTDKKSFERNDTLPEKTVELMLKKFYTSYINCFSTSPIKNLNQKLDSLKHQYSTLELQNFINWQFQENELDWNPYIDAQDIDTTCIKTLIIRKDIEKENLYYVSFFMPRDTSQHRTIKLIVVKEKGGYKIDYIHIAERIDKRYEIYGKDSTIVLK